MTKFLVTGATGLVGNNVTRMLLDRGDAVRVLRREGSDERPFADLEVEEAPGDVCHPDSIEKATRRRRRGHPLCRPRASRLERHWKNTGP